MGSDFRKIPIEDADLACEADLLDQFRTLVERGLRAGWAEEEVANALLSLAQNYAIDFRDDALIEKPPSRTLQ